TTSATGRSCPLQNSWPNCAATRPSPPFSTADLPPPGGALSRVTGIAVALPVGLATNVTKRHKEQIMQWPQAGFTGNRTTDAVNLSIGGMRGERCVSSVRSALSLIRGVQAVEVSLESGCATVYYDAE